MGKFNIKDDDDFRKMRKEADGLYQSIAKIFCPYFKSDIVFNAKGIRHLRFKHERVARPRVDQYARLKLLKYAPKVLAKSHTLQGLWKTKKFESTKSGTGRAKVLKEVTYYEFIAVLDSIRVKVVIKEVFGGEKYLWSIIPSWGIDKKASKRILHTGNPEHD